MLPLNYINGIDLPKVKGLDRAKAYQTQPNSRCVVFEEDDDLFYIIQTDAMNNKTSINRYRFVEEPIETELDAKYASKKDLAELKEMMSDVQQSIRELAKSRSNTNAGSGSNVQNLPNQRKSNGNVKPSGNERS